MPNIDVIGQVQSYHSELPWRGCLGVARPQLGLPVGKVTVSTIFARSMLYPMEAWSGLQGGQRSDVRWAGCGSFLLACLKVVTLDTIVR